MKRSDTVRLTSSGAECQIRDGVHPCSQCTSVGLDIGDIRSCSGAGACVDARCD